MELTFPTLKKLHQTLSNIEKIDRKSENLSARNRTTMPKKLQQLKFQTDGIEDLGLSLLPLFDTFPFLLPSFKRFMIFMQGQFLRLPQERQKKSSNRTGEICGQKRNAPHKSEVRFSVVKPKGTSDPRPRRSNEHPLVG